jgi:hypothetical protein
MKEGYALNPETGRIISKTTSKYKKMVKMGLIVENDEKVKKVEKKPVPEPEPESEPEFCETKLQTKIADISTTLIKDNLKSIVKAQKLTDKQMDIMLKKLLFRKLCMEPEPKKKPKKKRYVESSSDSDSI